jgi:uncharacterized membrane protein
MLTPIIILIILASPLAIAFIHAKVNHSPLNVTKFSCWGLGLAFLFFFVGHLVKSAGMVEMLPPWLPFRLAIVYLTGLLELVIAIKLFIPKYQKTAAKVAIAVFVVFFPANIYSAINSIGLGGHQWGAVYLLIRTPLQIILISWAYFLCLKSYNKAVD